MENKKSIDTPLVSVLIPAYNAALYIEKAIDSVLAQTYQNIEIVVVNDGSKDGTAELLENIKLKDSRVLVFHNEKNLGLSPTRNKGVKLCNGKFIALLDADDLIAPERLEKQVEFLENNQSFSAVSTWMEEFDVKGNNKTIRYRRDLNEIKSVSMFYSPVSHAASMFHASVLKQLGYRNEFFFAEDYDMWIRFLQNHKVGVIPEVLYYYRSHATQSIKPGNELKKQESHLKIIESIHSYLQIESTDELRKFHLSYLFNQEEITTFDTFQQWDTYLQKLMYAKNSYLDKEAFQQFVWVNFWQTPFYSLLPKMNWKERIVTIQSPFCKLSKVSKMKILIKPHIK